MPQFPPKPVWLDEQQQIEALLVEFVNKLDRQSADQRIRPPGVTITPKTFPSLYDLGIEADQQWMLLKSLQSDYDVVTIVLKRPQDPFDPEYKNARVRFNLAAEDTVRAWLNKPKQLPQLVHWQQLVDDQASRFPGSIERLRARPITLASKSPQQILEAFVNINIYSQRNITLRQLSALCFWGHSKFLDNREELLTRLYPNIKLRSRPVVVNVFLPESPTAVLFIENQDSYTAALMGVPAMVSDMALVFSAGFKSSARRIREEPGVSLHFHSATCAPEITLFENWWFDKTNNDNFESFFWGDLDYAGMAILKALKARFPQLEAWQPGYELLLKQLEAGHGHRAEVSDKQAQSDPLNTGCTYADNVLLPALRTQKRFIDQEVIAEGDYSTR